MKAISPLLGFNNNIKHRGRLFHIQTEDSGIKHPHVITHLFADGGRILKTTKTSYLEHVGSERLADVVRELMKEQHKAMFIALRDGGFDHLFVEDAEPSPSPSPPPAAADPIEGPPMAPIVARPVVSITAAARVSSPLAAASEASPPVSVHGRRAAPDPFATAPPGLALDLSALESEPLPTKAPRAEASPREGPSRAKSPSGRYVASRPAAIFSATSPDAGGSIFGDDLISEKSLDEVILSYLSDDLESTGSKK
jgi:hypothetical protein